MLVNLAIVGCEPPHPVCEMKSGRRREGATVERAPEPARNDDFRTESIHKDENGKRPCDRENFT